jgi:hypothetical protein
MKSSVEFRVLLALLMLMSCTLVGCISKGTMGRVETADFVFHYPRGFVPIPVALEKEVVFLYGDGQGNSINVSRFGYLAGKDLSEAACIELTEAFNISELRTMINASAAMAKKFTSKDGLKICYYYYDFQRPNGTSRVEYKVYQGADSRTYAITIVYDSNSLQQKFLQEALHSFKIK